MDNRTTEHNCSTIFRSFLEKDILNWTPWTMECAECCLNDFFISKGDEVTGFAGNSNIPAQFHYCKIDHYQNDVRVWYRSNSFLKVETEFPDINIPVEKEFKGLDAPVTKMDYSFGGFFIPGGEWVYPTLGIALFLNGDYNRVIKVTVFLPCSFESYTREIRTSGTVREF